MPDIRINRNDGLNMIPYPFRNPFDAVPDPTEYPRNKIPDRLADIIPNMVNKAFDRSQKGLDPIQDRIGNPF